MNYQPHTGDKIVRVYAKKGKKLLWTFVSDKYPQTGTEVISENDINFKIIERVIRMDHSIDLFVKKERDIKVNQYKTIKA